MVIGSRTCATPTLPQDNPQWEPFPWEIEGFDFEPGFETRLLVRPVAEYDDAKGGYEVKYRLTKLISSEEKVSEGIPDK